MAAGDIVANIVTTTANYVNFQPAAGVELMITALSDATGTQYIFYDGSKEAWSSNADILLNTKIGITNTIYARFYYGSATGNIGFSAIQVK
jgi:hypothetical protein